MRLDCQPKMDKKWLEVDGLEFGPVNFSRTLVLERLNTCP